MATIFVHIGTHKTGTTSLQYFLKRNYLTLLELGYLYPQAGRIQKYNFAHHGLAWQILGQRPLTIPTIPNCAIPEWLEVYWKAGNQMVFKSTGQHLILDNEWKKLTAEIDEKVIDNVILSSEDFLILSPWEIRYLQDQLSQHEIKIVIYLRTFEDFALSLYQEAVKKGYQQSFGKFLQTYQSFFDYDRLLQPWIEVFSADNILIIPYHKESISKNIMILFLNRIGINPTPENIEKFKFYDTRTNLRSPLKIIGFILILNRFFIGILRLPLRICRRLYIQPLHKKILYPIIQKLPHCFWFNPTTIDLVLKNYSTFQNSDKLRRDSNSQ